MAHILVHHKVEEYNKWEKAFDAHSNFRTENGSVSEKVFRNAEDSNDVFVLLEFQSIATGKNFAQSDNLRDVMKEAGVVGIPSVYFLE